MMIYKSKNHRREGKLYHAAFKRRILKDGVVKPGNVLKVDSFLNHQMDIDLINEIGKEFRRRFPSDKITKILTIEASGIGIACIVAQYFGVPVVFAKKTQSINIDGEVYHTKVESFTHKRTYDVILSKKFLNEDDHVLKRHRRFPCKWLCNVRADRSCNKVPALRSKVQELSLRKECKMAAI